VDAVTRRVVPPWWQRGRGGHGSPSGSGRAASLRRVTCRPRPQRKKDQRRLEETPWRAGRLPHRREEPRQVDDAGLLVLAPGHGLEKADAGLNAGVDEEQESSGEEVEGIAGGADGTREIECV
jgi:hypothetical protein